MEWLNFIIEPLSYPFMQRAIIVSITTGFVCAILSCFLVLKGWSLMGDAISHAVLPGIVLAYLGGIPIIIGAFASGFFCSLATGLVWFYFQKSIPSNTLIIFYLVAYLVPRIASLFKLLLSLLLYPSLP